MPEGFRVEPDDDDEDNNDEEEEREEPEVLAKEQPEKSNCFLKDFAAR